MCKYNKDEKMVVVSIGAGDTLLAAFVVKFVKTYNLVESANFAQVYTEKFLITKNV